MVTVHDHLELGHIELREGARPSRSSRAATRRLGARGRRRARRGAPAQRRDGLAGAARARARLAAERPTGQRRSARVRRPHRPPRPASPRRAEASRPSPAPAPAPRCSRATRSGPARDRRRARHPAGRRAQAGVTPEAKLEIVRALQQGGAIGGDDGRRRATTGPRSRRPTSAWLWASAARISRGPWPTWSSPRTISPSLTEAVCEGRRLHDNVRRAIAYFVATNASEVLAMLVGALCGASPLTPLQLLWINLLTDVAPALALALEPAEPGVMRRPPRDPAARLLGAADLRALGVDAAAMSGASLSAYAPAAGPPRDEGVHGAGDRAAAPRAGLPRRRRGSRPGGRAPPGQPRTWPARSPPRRRSRRSRSAPVSSAACSGRSASAPGSSRSPWPWARCPRCSAVLWGAPRRLAARS